MAKEKFMAWICEICPLCIFARKFPQSRIAKIVAREKQHCPFCRAYERVKGITGG